MKLTFDSDTFDVTLEEDTYPHQDLNLDGNECGMCAFGENGNNICDGCGDNLAGIIYSICDIIGGCWLDNNKVIMTKEEIAEKLNIPVGRLIVRES